MYVLMILKDIWDTNSEDENSILIDEFLGGYKKIIAIFTTKNHVNIVAERK